MKKRLKKILKIVLWIIGSIFGLIFLLLLVPIPIIGLLSYRTFLKQLPEKPKVKEMSLYEEIPELNDLIKSYVYKQLKTLQPNFKDIDLKEIAKKLKSEFACGGTVKNNTIELQGDHKKKMKQALMKLGFPEDSISE